jgi:hypothetical protein
MVVPAQAGAELSATHNSRQRTWCRSSRQLKLVPPTDEENEIGATHEPSGRQSEIGATHNRTVQKSVQDPGGARYVAEKATSILQASGIKVGLLGANHSSI